MERNILEVARLIEFLIGNHSKADKVTEIKAVRDNGDITEDEAFELALEYLNNEYIAMNEF